LSGFLGLVYPVGLDPGALDEPRESVFREAHNSQALVVIKNGLVVGEVLAKAFGARVLCEGEHDRN
jgi:hypothetical protein